MSSWPNWIYEKFMFDLWMATGGKIRKDSLKEHIEATYEDDDIIQVSFNIEWSTGKIKNLCEMRSQALLHFDQPQFEDDYIDIKITKKEFLNKLDWIASNFKQIEVDKDIKYLW